MTKNTLILVFIVFNVLILNAQENYIKIDIATVSLPKAPLEQLPYKTVIEKRIGGNLESFHYENNSQKLVSTNLHPFVAALHYSFAEHRPMVISPDMVWLMISQSFSIHINQNQEKYRARFVDFNAKQSISIVRNDFIKGEIKNPWIEVFPVIADSISKYLVDSIESFMIPKFSTTGISEKAAFEVSLMDVTKGYFDYDMYTFCGIPYIKLEGKPSDWKWILDNLDNFDSYDLEFWTKKLKPIIEEIYQSSLGNSKVDFWKNIYNWHQSSYRNYTDGWFTNFFLYKKDSNDYSLNPLITYEEDTSATATTSIRGVKIAEKGMNGSEFISGMSKVDFNWYYLSNDTFYMEFHAGFVGIKQDTITLELRPEISYAIVDKENEEISNENYTILDFPNKYCYPGPYYYTGLNQMPIYNPYYNDNFRESEKELKLKIRTKLKQKFPSYQQTTFSIKFTILASGEITKVYISGVSDRTIQEYLNSLMYSYSDWQAAVINGIPADYELKLEFYE